MIDTLESRLHSAMEDREMVDAMLRGIEAFERYRHSLPFEPFAYTRTLLLKRPHFELVAMQWSPGSLSPIHDHGTSRCWVVLADGMLDVDNFERHDDGAGVARLGPTSSLQVSRGELDHRLNWKELHRVRNSQPESAFSLQLYSPVLTEYHVVNEDTGICAAVQAVYDSICEL